MSRRQRILHRLTWLLVATIGAIAFTASFEAIADYAGQVGWGSRMKYAAPLLVDTFTVAAGLVILARAEDGVRAVYAWCLLVAAAGVSIGLNIAHAPEQLSARFVAALPPAALLAAVELAMSEARRSRKTTTSEVGGRRPRQGQGREAGPTTTPPAPAAKGSPRVRLPLREGRPGGSTPAAAPARSGVAPTAPERATKPERDRSADAKAERKRIVRSELAQDHDRSANKIKPALRSAGVGVGDSTEFYALVDQTRSEMKQESNGAPERIEVGA